MLRSPPSIGSIREGRGQRRRRRHTKTPLCQAAGLTTHGPLASPGGHRRTALYSSCSRVSHSPSLFSPCSLLLAPLTMSRFVTLLALASTGTFLPSSLCHLQIRNPNRLAVPHFLQPWPSPRPLISPPPPSARPSPPSSTPAPSPSAKAPVMLSRVSPPFSRTPFRARAVESASPSARAGST
jgi:hypothetical protein